MNDHVGNLSGKAIKTRVFEIVGCRYGQQKQRIGGHPFRQRRTPAKWQAGLVYGHSAACLPGPCFLAPAAPANSDIALSAFRDLEFCQKDRPLWQARSFVSRLEAR